MNTNISHNLADSEYNTRRKECEKGLEVIQSKFPLVKSFRDVNQSILDDLRLSFSETIFNRCSHVISENLRVLEATNALVEKDFLKLGTLIYQSHESLSNKYNVSCDELDFLVSQTRDKDYILGSRMMGGGFGGCTLSLIEKDKTIDFIKDVTISYEKKFGVIPTPYQVSIQDGSGLIEN